MGFRVPKPGDCLRIALLLGVGLAAVPPAFAQSPGNSNITGLPPEALERLPAAAKLFQVRNASGPPRILDHPFKAGEIVARFPLELGDGQIDQLARSLGAHGVERASPLGLFLVRGPNSVQGLEKLMERLWESGEAVTLDANYMGELSFIPDDPLHTSGAQWHHESSSDIDLDMRSAWNITRGSEDVVIAVVDSGLKAGHPEFSGRLYENPNEVPFDGIDNDGNGFVDDYQGWDAVGEDNDPADATGVKHGTWVASTLLANSHNAFQIASMDHFARLLPVRAFETSAGSTLHVLAALDYLVANPGVADIVNMSFADFGESVSMRRSLETMAETAILIGGAGNQGAAGGADSNFPESHPDVITFAGTDRFDSRAAFSDTGNSVDFAAPAVDIYTASFDDPNNPFAFHVGTGTSFAAPIGAGIASLCLAIKPAMTKSDLLAALRISAVDLGAPGRDQSFGWGRVNAHQALLTLQTILFTDDFETGDMSQWSFSSP